MANLIYGNPHIPSQVVAKAVCKTNIDGRALIIPKLSDSCHIHNAMVEQLPLNHWWHDTDDYEEGFITNKFEFVLEGELPDRPILMAACIRKNVASGEQILMASVRHRDPILNPYLRSMDPDRSLWFKQGVVEEQGFLDQQGNFLTRREAWDLMFKSDNDLYVDRGYLPAEGLLSEGIY